MEQQKPSEKYTGNWKRSPYPRKSNPYQKNDKDSILPSLTVTHKQATGPATSETGLLEASSPEKISDFRDLHIWKLGKEIVLDVYRVTKSFPSEELYGLTAQMRRAAISIPSNISEGFNRRYTKDYQRFLSIALGSCAELETQAEVGKDLGYLSQNGCSLLLEKTDHETRMIRSLMNKL